MGYAGDMSSTMPADKKFTTRQKEIYDIQVASHEAAVAALPFAFTILRRFISEDEVKAIEESMRFTHLMHQ